MLLTLLQRVGVKTLSRLTISDPQLTKTQSQRSVGTSSVRPSLAVCAVIAVVPEAVQSAEEVLHTSASYQGLEKVAPITCSHTDPICASTLAAKNTSW